MCCVFLCWFRRFFQEVKPSFFSFHLHLVPRIAEVDVGVLVGEEVVREGLPAGTEVVDGRLFGLTGLLLGAVELGLEVVD